MCAVPWVVNKADVQYSLDLHLRWTVASQAAALPRTTMHLAPPPDAASEASALPRWLAPLFTPQIDMLQPGKWGSLDEFGLRYCDGREALDSWQATAPSRLDLRWAWAGRQQVAGAVPRPALLLVASVTACCTPAE